MKLPNWIGPSSRSQVATNDAQRTVNFYLEKSDSRGATTDVSLCPWPGVELIVATNSSDGRAHIFILGREFAVQGSSLIEYDSDGVPTFRGTVAVDTNPATISSNGDGGDQLFITSGSNGYLFTLSTNAFAAIPALAGIATMGDQLDGYFLAIDAATGTLYSSELEAGATWNTGVMFAQRNSAPDPWVAMKVKGKLIYLQGTQTSEIWFNNGSSPFPFAPHPSGNQPYGTGAAFSVAVCGDSILWLAASKDGKGTVKRAAGFTPEDIASYEVAFALNGYTVTSDARGDGFSYNGHDFYILSFPTANHTWCYDLQMQVWFELGSWDPAHTANDYGVYRPRYHVVAFGEHRWLHATGTGLYRMVPLGTDVDGLSIRRERIGPTLEAENERMFFSQFELDLEPGLGLTTGQGSDPQVMLQMSNDGGKTWGTERWRSAGKIGQYAARVMWDRLGAARRRVFKIVMTDPIPWRITNAYVRLEREESSERGAA